MEKTELFDQIKATIGKIKVLALGQILTDNNFDLRDLVDATLYPDDAIAFRAAWLLENVFLQYPERYLSQLEYLISKIKTIKSPGAKRHYAKIIMHITDLGAHPIIKNEVQNTDMEQVVEQLFDWMIDPEIKIAVKVFSAEALLNLRHRYGWITQELTDQLHYLMQNGTAAIQSKGKKLLKQLNN